MKFTENEFKQDAMPILQNIAVPTGNILVVDGERGKLEVLSIGDYGKEVNLTGTGQVSDNLPLVPLQRKWVVTLSTQYGCSMGCTFCDVPRVGKGVNATLPDLQRQTVSALNLHPDVTWSNRLNIHYARMGEPTFNPQVLNHAKWAKEHIDPEYATHPVLTTMMPANHEWLETFIHNWVRIKNRIYRGNAGLQLSINSTCEKERSYIFNKNSLPLYKIARMLESCIPIGRKFTLNFAVCNWEIDPRVLLQYFDPERYLIKLTPMHETKNAKQHNHKTEGDYTSATPFKKTYDSLISAGYETLMFITSEDEDLSRITCGNAVLGKTTAKPERLRDGDLVFTNELVQRQYHIV